MSDFPVLVTLLREPARASNLDSAQWESVISQSRKAGVFTLLMDYLRRKHLRLYGASEIDLPAKVAEVFRAEDCSADKLRNAVHWEAGILVKILQSAGVKPIFLKGAAYVLAGTGAGNGRLFSDLDILVPGTEIKKVEKRLIAHGWNPAQLDDYDQLYFRQWMHEIPPLVHITSNTTLDVHHTILALTAKQTPDAEALIADAVESPFAGAFVLSPTDMVLHSAAHLFSEGELEMGLRGLMDLDSLMMEFAQADQGFWDALVVRAGHHQLERPLYYALRYCRLLLKSDIPSDVEARLSDRPSGMSATMMDTLYRYSLMPDHPEADCWFTLLARLALYVRGHYLRMPLTILLPHLIRKSWVRYQRKKSTQQVTG